ncbi:MAG: hypothetical protein V1703_00315 [Candidatus Altiarchaeota archaeon]
MKPTTPIVRTIFFYAMLFCVAAIFVAGTASADIDIQDGIRVDVSPSEIKSGDSFTVNITFQNPDDSDSVDVRVLIEVDGVVVHNRTQTIDLHEGNDTRIGISSSDFRVGGDRLWDSSYLIKYECDEHTVRVEVSGSDINDLEDEDTLSIVPNGDEDEMSLSFSIEPPSPLIDDDILITVEDGDNDPRSGAIVRFTWIDDDNGYTVGEWDPGDDSENAPNTDSDGETTFNIQDDFKNEYGKYQIDVYKSNYCMASSQTITLVEGELTVGNPEPSNPKVGEQFKIKLSGGADPIKGAKAWINELGVNIKSTSDQDGYLKFTISKSGTFTISINASNYGMFEKQVTVSELNSLVISITPVPAEINSPVAIVVYSDSNALSGVSLTITKPEGGKDVKTTGSDGKAAYTPSKVGSYTVTAVKDGYRNATETFVVNSAFDVQVPDAKTIVYDSDLTITVLDSETNVPVNSALVSGTGVPSGTKTNSMGQFTVKLGSSGQYTFLISKNGYTDKGVSVVALCKLSLRLNSTSAEMGQPIGIRVYDKEKNDYVSGNIAVSKPDGTSDLAVESDYAYTPTLFGTYKIALSKANCIGDEISLEVKSKTLSLESELKDSQILIRTVAGGKPASGVAVEVTSPSGVKANITSDENGLITITAIEEGNYTITSKDSRYSSESISLQKQSSILKKYWWVVLAAVIIALIAFLLLLVVALFLRSRGKQDSSFKKGKGSSLQ